MEGSFPQKGNQIRLVALFFANYEHAIFVPSPAGGRGSRVRVDIMFPLTCILSPEGRGNLCCDEHLTNLSFSGGIGR